MAIHPQDPRRTRLVTTGSVLFPFLPYDPNETVESFVRRFGQMHTGRDAQRLLADLRIDYRDWVSGSTDAAGALAAKTGIDAAALIRGTFRRLQRSREFRGEAWSIDFIRGEGDRVCPECLWEDAAAEDPLALKGRIAWRFTLSRAQHDPRPPNHLARGVAFADHRLEFGSIGGAKIKADVGASHHPDMARQSGLGNLVSGVEHQVALAGRIVGILQGIPVPGRQRCGCFAAGHVQAGLGRKMAMFGHWRRPWGVVFPCRRGLQLSPEAGS